MVSEEPKNKERKNRKVIFDSRSLKVNANMWVLLFHHASSQGSNSVGMVLLDIFMALVSVGLWTTWRNSFANTRAMS